MISVADGKATEVAQRSDAQSRLSNSRKQARANHGPLP